MSSQASAEDIAQAKAETEFLVTPSQLYQTLEHCLSAVTVDGETKEQANVMVWGAMGIGKTDVCRTLGVPWGMRIVSLHLPQYDPTDLKGIPAEYGSLISVTTHAAYPGWAQLWFEDDQKTIRLVRIEFHKHKIKSILERRLSASTPVY